MRRGLGGRIILSIAGVTQLVECNLAKVDVEGSNPFARSGEIPHAGGVIRMARGGCPPGRNPFARSNEVRAGEPPQFPEG